jgi:HSP20 family molecular chaperone IbpA
MRSQPVRPVTVKRGDTEDLGARLESVGDRVRRRAYDLYCRRGKQSGNPLGDWTLAEHESSLAPLAGVAVEDREVRITACVPNVDASELTVDALPNEIIIEADRNGTIQRYTRFHLPARIDPDRVKAHLRGSELEVVAPKAKNG